MMTYETRNHQRYSMIRKLPIMTYKQFLKNHPDTQTKKCSVCSINIAPKEI